MHYIHSAWLISRFAAFLGSVYAGPFCPGEVCDEAICDECKAKPNEFKCGIFYKDLTKRRPLTWIGAIPDALNDSNKDKWESILGPKSGPKDFKNFVCDAEADRRANARCYTILSPLASKPLDSCEGTVLNSHLSRKDTLGNSLCDQAIKFLKHTRRYKQENIGNIGLKNQGMSFYYSACGSDWRAVRNTGNGQYLEVQNDLCCRPDGKYEPCSGRTNYTQSCPQ